MIYVVVTKPMVERRAVRDIRRAGVPVYAPMATRVRYAMGRKLNVQSPLLHGYVFVWSLDIAADRARFRSSPYVADVLGHDGRAVDIDSGWLAALLIAQCFGCFDYTLDRKPPMRVGQLVRIIAGQFQGVMATITRVGNGDKVSVEIGKGVFHGKTELKADQLAAA